MTERVPPTPDGLTQAATILEEGGVVAIPTDTVYGLACVADRPEALERIFELKRRPAEKRVVLLVASLDDVAALGYVPDDRARWLASRFWPGALTVVLPSPDGEGSQGFRAPDHPVALDLIRRVGAIYASSANVSGEPETQDADEVLVAFAGESLLAAVLDAGRVPGGVASTVVDLSSTPARLLREGPVTRHQLAHLIE